MMFWSKKYKQTRALKALFLLPDGSLKPEAQTVLQWLAEEVNAKGHRLDGGNSALFGKDGNFDAAKVAYWAGQRRVFDLIVSRLAVDSVELFALCVEEDKKREELEADFLTL